MDIRKKNFIVQALRRASYRWEGRWQAENRSKIVREIKGTRKFYDYYCEQCGIIAPKSETQMDHIEPIVNPKTGFQGFNDEYMDRFFPYKEGWQRLCKSCHDIKSLGENLIRSKTNQKKKKKKT